MHHRMAVSLLLLVLAASTSASGQTASAFYPGGTYDARVSPPDSSLGFPLGERPARYPEVVRTIRLLTEQSPRCVLRQSHGA